MARLKLNLKGFDKMLEQLQAAGADVDKAAQRAITASAKIVENELRSEATAKGVPSDITAEITTRTSQSSDQYEAKVGWKLGSYDPRKPSAGYKAIFLNYGTVRRVTKKGASRGEIPKRTEAQQFIYMAKKKARPKVKKAQQTIMERVMRDLEK